MKKLFTLAALTLLSVAAFALTFTAGSDND